MYDELIKRLRECTAEQNGEKTLWHQAADAIEELQKITTHYEEESKGWWLAACDAKEERERLKEQLDNAEIENIKLREEFARHRGKHLWIPVTKRLPEENGHYLVHAVGNGYYSTYIALWDGRFRANFEMPITHWMPLPQPPESDGEQ